MFRSDSATDGRLRQGSGYQGTFQETFDVVDCLLL